MEEHVKNLSDCDSRELRKGNDGTKANFRRKADDKFQ